ncbi:MAG: ORF6N domain-containing protein [Clostridia bacterium]|nr:ORF6N domain-containing protein [Clostridia bacterium]
MESFPPDKQIAILSPSSIILYSSIAFLIWLSIFCIIITINIIADVSSKKNINKAVKRNVDRFPECFCFQLIKKEMDKM